MLTGLTPVTFGSSRFLKKRVSHSRLAGECIMGEIDWKSLSLSFGTCIHNDLQLLIKGSLYLQGFGEWEGGGRPSISEMIFHCYGIFGS